jgi:anti-sigma regulatory factor (Ser/Thr protein kinase)
VKRPTRGPRRLERRITPPTLNSVAEVEDALDRWARAVRLPEERRRELLLAYDELASNVANYSKRATELRVAARRLASGAAVLIVEDDGRAFDPLKRRKPRIDQPLAERSIGGLGIHLVRELAARLTYERRAERNRIRFELPP